MKIMYDEPEAVQKKKPFFSEGRSRMLYTGLNTEARSRSSVQKSRQKGTVRGLHFQRPPHAETKVVRCTKGAIYDVIVDLRPDSPTHLRWTHVVLSADNRRMLYVPEGFAHGYQTLVAETEVFYQMSVPYAPGAEAGIAWNDPNLAISWPRVPERIISKKDRELPFLAPSHERRNPVEAG
jgi:dTDP-4-dehydrorhamnose 3,5-epimerase